MLHLISHHLPQEQHGAEEDKIERAEEMRRKAEVWATKEHEQLKSAEVLLGPPHYSDRGRAILFIHSNNKFMRTLTA